MKLKDTRGRESITLTLCVVAFSAILVKFVIAGMTIGSLGTMPNMGAGEFGLAFAAVIAPWLHREYVEKKKDVGSN